MTKGIFKAFILAVAVLFAVVCEAQTPGETPEEYWLNGPEVFAAEPGEHTRPALARHAASGITLVAWETETGIYTRRFDDNGPMDPAPVFVGVGTGVDVAASKNGFGLAYYGTYTNNEAIPIFQPVATTGVAASGMWMSTGTNRSIVLPGERATIASDGTNYMALWVRGRAGQTSGLIGQVMREAGPALGGNFEVATGHPVIQPDITWGAGAYVATWRDGRTAEASPNYEIYAAEISPTGTVFTPNGLRVANNARARFLPRVAFNGTDYLVATATEGTDGYVDRVEGFWLNVLLTVTRQTNISNYNLQWSEGGSDRGLDLMAMGADFHLAWLSRGGALPGSSASSTNQFDIAKTRIQSGVVEEPTIIVGYDKDQTGLAIAAGASGAGRLAWSDSAERESVVVGPFSGDAAIEASARRFDHVGPVVTETPNGFISAAWERVWDGVGWTSRIRIDRFNDEGATVSGPFYHATGQRHSAPISIASSGVSTIVAVAADLILYIADDGTITPLSVVVPDIDLSQTTPAAVIWSPARNEYQIVCSHRNPDNIYRVRLTSVNSAGEINDQGYIGESNIPSAPLLFPAPDGGYGLLTTSETGSGSWRHDGVVFAGGTERRFSISHSGVAVRSWTAAFGGRDVWLAGNKGTDSLLVKVNVPASTGLITPTIVATIPAPTTGIEVVEDRLYVITVSPESQDGAIIEWRKIGFDGTAIGTPSVKGHSRSNGPAAFATKEGKALLLYSGSFGNPPPTWAGELRVQPIRLEIELPLITVGDISGLETDSGLKRYNFPVRLSKPSTVEVKVFGELVSGTATMGDDFRANIGTITFAPGQTSGIFGIIVNGDMQFEASETAYVRLRSPVNAVIGRSEAQLVIVNDDSEVSVGDASVVEGDSDFTLNIPVTLQPASPFATRVDFSVNTGTAGPADIAPGIGFITIPAGATSAVIRVGIVGDDTVEMDETFTVQLTAVDRGSIGRAQGTVTIVNDDHLPTLSVNDIVALERDSSLKRYNFTVTLSEVSPVDVKFNAALVNGTATMPDDFRANLGTVTIPQGQTSVLFGIIVAGDTIVEPSETAIVQLSNPVNATIARGEGTALILNDDVKVRVEDMSVIEGDTTNLIGVRFTLSQPNVVPTTIEYEALEGSTTAGSDHPIFNHSITIPTGATEFIQNVMIIGDAVQEPDEFFRIQILNVANAIASKPVGLVTIIDDDWPTLSVNDIAGVETDSGLKRYNFTVSLDRPASVDVKVSINLFSGSAIINDDFRPNAGTLTIPAGQLSVLAGIIVNGDTTIESDETAIIRLANPINARIKKGEGTLVILNDDHPPTLFVNDIAVRELDSSLKRYNFTVSLSKPATADVKVFVELSGGTATMGDDFRANLGTITFTVGQTNALVGIIVQGDTTVEADETAFINLSKPVNAVIGRAQGRALILNDDVRVHLVDGSIAEGDTGLTTGQVGVVLSAPHVADVQVAYVLHAGSANSGSDFIAATNSVTIAAGATEASIPVDILSDSTPEPNEVLSVQILSVSNAIIGRGTAALTITNDDPYPQLSVNDLEGIETDSGLKRYNFTISIDRIVDYDVKVSIQLAGGSAVMGEDFRANTGVIVIKAGQQQALAGIIVNGDTTVEQDETAHIHLSNPVNAQIQDGSGTLVIVNDDGPIAVNLDAFNSATVGAGWTQPDTFFGTGESVFALQSNRLELQNPTGALSTVMRSWGGVARYDQSWAVQVDTYIGDWTGPLTGESAQISLNVNVVNLSDTGDSIIFSALTQPNDSGWPDRFVSTQKSLNNTFSGLPGAMVFDPDQPQNSVSLQVRFDAASKEFIVGYDLDGPANGYRFVEFNRLDIDAVDNNWGMNTASRFGLRLSAHSRELVVPAGFAYFDNLRSTSFASPMAP